MLQREAWSCWNDL